MRYSTLQAAAAGAVTTVCALLLLIIVLARLRRNQRTLKESEARLHLAVSVADLGAFEVDFRSEAGFFSPELRRILGYGPDERITLDLLNSRIKGPGVFAEAHGRPDEVREVRFVRPDGGTRWIQTKVRTFQTGQGSATPPNRLVGVVRDVTARREAEERLRERQATLGGFFEANAVYLSVMELAEDDFVYLHPNRKMAELFGCARPEEIEGRSGRDLDIAPGDIARWVALFRDCHTRQKPMTIEHSLSVGGRQTGWYIATVSPIHTGAYGRPRFAMAAVDITSRKLSEERLRESEARLRAAQAAGRVGVFEHEIASGRMQWDPCIRSIWAVPPQQVITYDLLLAGVHPDDREPTGAALEQAMDPAGNGEFETEFRVIGITDGIERWVSMAGRVTFNQGLPVLAIGTIQDVTDRKQGEERQTLLMREVDHRAKNSLAVVQAVIRLTRADTIEDFVAAVQGRVEALARSHELLAESKWRGADLRALVTQELRPYAAENPDRVRVTGPDLGVATEAVQCLGMVVHELATNAAKYGALSAKEGTVDVGWTIEAGGRREGGLARTRRPEGRQAGSPRLRVEPYCQRRREPTRRLFGVPLGARRAALRLHGGREPGSAATRRASDRGGRGSLVRVT